MDEIVWKYTGKGEFFDGIPARDLTQSDMARMDEDRKAVVERSGLYRRAPRRIVAAPGTTELVVNEGTRPGIEDAAKGDKES